MAASAETIELINNLLDQDRKARGNLTWQELAEEYDVNTTTIWKWRRGRALGTAVATLLPLTKKYCPCQDDHTA